MNTNNILNDSYLNLLFKNKNKLYGAYELRTNYNFRLLKSLSIVMGICILFIAANKLIKPKKNTSTFIVKDIISGKAKIEKKLKEIKKETLKKQIQKRANEQKVLTPKPSKDNFEKTIIIDTNAKFSDRTVLDSNKSFVANIPIDTSGKLNIITPIINPKNGDTVLTTPLVIVTPIKKDVIETEVDEQAIYEGNWKNYLERNLNAELASENGAEAGRYRVNVEFIVDLDGSISNVKAISNVGYQLEQEAVRVIKKSKQWQAAKIQGQKVKAFKTQTIIFEVL